MLPGGYWDASGRLHREVEFATVTGRDEELLAQADLPQTASTVTEVLSRCVQRLGEMSPVPPDVIRELLVADRNYLLLRLRRATFGDLVRAHLVCPWPNCGEPLSIDFSIDAVPVEEPPCRAPLHTITLSAAASTELDGTEVVFRLPTGADQEELSGQLAANEARTLTALLARCVQRLGPHQPPTQQRLAELPAPARREIEEAMWRLAPKVGQEMDARCTTCGRGFVVPFDIHRFVLGELRTDCALLYQEVHNLAFHYHWSEQEIMAMTRDKRRTYLDVLAGAIEVLNNGD